MIHVIAMDHHTAGIVVLSTEDRDEAQRVAVLYAATQNSRVVLAEDDGAILTPEDARDLTARLAAASVGVLTLPLVDGDPFIQRTDESDDEFIKRMLDASARADERKLMSSSGDDDRTTID